MQPFKKDRNICYMFVFTHFSFSLLNDTWCNEYIMDVILPPLGYVNEEFCSHNSLYSNWKMQVLKSQLSLFHFGLAKTVENIYASANVLRASIKYIICALKDICVYETEVTVTFWAEAFPKTMFRLRMSSELFSVLYSIKIRLIQSLLQYNLKHGNPIIFSFLFLKEHSLLILINFNHFSKVLDNKITD